MKISDNWKRSHSAFGEILRGWRKQKRLSQLDLSLEIGISSKHLSFIETGRSKPSREMILKISDSLKLPMRQHNALLTSAGYTANFSEEPLESPRFEIIREALSRILEKHNPYPAFVVNSKYDLLKTNSGFDQMIPIFIEDTQLANEKNIMKLTFNPRGLSRYIQNWDNVSSFLLMRIWEEALTSKNEELLKLHMVLKSMVPSENKNQSMSELLLPALHLSLKKDEIEANFFTTITTLGTPLDVTTQEIRIEALFPADEKTKKLFE